MDFPPPPKAIQNNLLSPTTPTFASPTTYHDDNNDTSNPENDQLSPKSTSFPPPPTIKAPPRPLPTTGTKTPLQSLNYVKPSTIPNWNDPPVSWANPSSLCTSSSRRPQTSRSSSSTALDINALYATANPRVAPRKRLSSMINTRMQTSVSAPTTPATVGGTPPAYQAKFYGGDGDKEKEWRDVKVEDGPRGSVSEVSGYRDEEVNRKRLRRKKTVKGLLIMMVLLTMGVLGVWLGGVPGLSPFGLMLGEGEMGDMPGAGFIERCKAMAWRPKMPEILAKYFMVGQGGEEEEGDVVEETEMQTITRTILLTNGVEYVMPTTVSRVVRGLQRPVQGDHGEHLEEVGSDGGNDSDEWEREHRGFEEQNSHVDGNSVENHGDASDQANEAEEEAHRASMEEMWANHDAAVHAAITPPADSEHGGHQEIFEGHEQ